MVDERYLANDIAGSILPVGMVWNYIGGIGIELNRCSHRCHLRSEQRNL